MWLHFADRFVRGELEPSGPPLVTTAHRMVMPANVTGAIEFEGRFGFHAWPAVADTFDAAAWSRELGAPHTLARMVPDDPQRLRYTPHGGLVVVELADDRLIAVHAYRFRDDPLDGAIASEVALLALYNLVCGADFSRATAERVLGRIGKRDGWRLELEPRAGANLERAELELSRDRLHGFNAYFEQPFEVDLAFIGARLGEPQMNISGNPPSFRRTHTFRGPAGSLSLSTYGTAISSVIVRRAAAIDDGPSTVAPASAPLGPDRAMAIVDAVFAGCDASALGTPLTVTPRRTRLAPHDPAFAGIVVTNGTTFEVELLPETALDAALLEPHLGVSRHVPPLHAKASAAARFHVANERYRGYVLVASDRLVVHRALPTTWLGDFARPDDITDLIARFAHDMTLTPEAVYAALGEPESDIEIGDGERSVRIRPYSGSNADTARVCFTLDDRGHGHRIDRIEVALHEPRALDTRRFGVPVSGPKPSLLKMDIVQYQARFAAPRFTAVALMNTVDQRPGPILLVRSMILARVIPGERDHYS